MSYGFIFRGIGWKELIVLSATGSFLPLNVNEVEIETFTIIKENSYHHKINIYYIYVFCLNGRFPPKMNKYWVDSICSTAVFLAADVIIFHFSFNFLYAVFLDGVILW